METGPADYFYRCVDRFLRRIVSHGLQGEGPEIPCTLWPVFKFGGSHLHVPGDRHMELVSEPERILMGSCHGPPFFGVAEMFKTVAGP